MGSTEFSDHGITETLNEFKTKTQNEFHVN